LLLVVEAAAKAQVVQVDCLQALIPCPTVKHFL
jgi:hypothetical protein